MSKQPKEANMRTPSAFKRDGSPVIFRSYRLGGTSFYKKAEANRKTECKVFTKEEIAAFENARRK